MPSLKVFDGFTALNGGMNGGTASNQLPENQFAMGVNITCRNGIIGTRPPFQEIVIESDLAGAVNRIQTGKFQGVVYYAYEGDEYIVFGFNGSVYLMDPIAQSIWDMTATPGRFNQYVDRLHFCQVDRYMIVQDGLNVPLVIEGTASRKADQVGANEVPTGTVMAYCHGRLFIKTGAYQFIAGNIHMPNTPGNVLVFTETQYLSGGGALYTPSSIGAIIAMTWAHAYGEATGQGPLLVMCEQGNASFQVSVPRDQWQDLPIMRIEPSGNGCASEFCIVKMNEDVMSMSWNGIQDFALVNVEVDSQHRLTNMNTEIQPLMDDETVWMRPFCHAAKFDDRFLFTAIGELCTSLDEDGCEVEDYRFKGLVSLDYSPINGIASLGETRKPSYDGIWTGVHPMGIASGLFNYDERCYVFGKDDDGINHLYELKKGQGHDNGVTPIQCKLYTRGMHFIAYDKDYPRPVPQYLKSLYDAYLWIRSFRDDIDFNLHVCPDNSMHFHLISTISVNAPMQQSVSPFENGNMQARAKCPFPAFKTTECETITGRNAITGFELQFLLEWSGVTNLERCWISADADMEVKSFECGTNEVILLGVPRDNYTYDLEA